MRRIGKEQRSWAMLYEPQPGREFIPRSVASLSAPPCDACGDGDGRAEGLCLSGLSCGEASPAFQAAEHPLDDVALVADVPVTGEQDAAVAHGRDDGGSAPHGPSFADGVSVITLVGDQLRGWRQLADAMLNNRDISGISGCCDDRPASAIFVASGVEPDSSATVGRADTVSQDPDFPPPAVR